MHKCLRCIKSGTACIYSCKCPFTQRRVAKGGFLRRKGDSLIHYVQPTVKKRPGRPLVTSLSHQDSSAATLEILDGASLHQSDHLVPSPLSPINPDMEEMSRFAYENLSAANQEHGLDKISLSTNLCLCSDISSGDFGLLSAADPLFPPGRVSMTMGDALGPQMARLPNSALLQDTAGSDVVQKHNDTNRHAQSTTSFRDLKDLEAWVEQLSKLNIRILCCARSIVNHESAPLTSSSPELEDIFESTASLINIIQRVCQSSDATARSIISGGFDRGLGFLILAVHKRLLHVFSAVCTSVRRIVRGADSCAGSRPSMTQLLMVMQLLIHLLSQLDRAFAEENLTSSRGDREDSVGDLLVYNSGQLGQIGFDFLKSPENMVADWPDGNNQMPGMHRTSDVAKTLMTEIGEQHDILRQEIESVKEDIESSTLL